MKKSKYDMATRPTAGWQEDAKQKSSAILWLVVFMALTPVLCSIIYFLFLKV